MSNSWTDDQRDAIRTHDRNLLVSAAAGSGKTAVLAERCAFLVCDAPQPCNADELLVVTFTVAAADEMRRRIALALSRKIAKSEDPRLVRQPMLLVGAQIGTIHGLCSAILRRHFHETGLDPAFRLLDQEEADLLRRDIAEAVVERALEGPDAAVTNRLLDEYAGGVPSRIVDVLLGLHAKMSSLCDPRQWLADRRARLAEASEKSVRDSVLGKKALRIVYDKITSLRAAAERLHGVLLAANVPTYATAMRGVAAAAAGWQKALAQRPFDQAAHIIADAEFPRLPNMNDPAIKEKFQKTVSNLKSAASKFGKEGILLFTESELQEGVAETLWAVDHLTALAAEFDARYDAAKHDANTLDFADLERKTLGLLRDANTGAPTPIALDYRKHFRHVLVDEYQDVNELQDTLLAMVANEPGGNLFCVGDVKQSIYRFRQADPARFIARTERYRTAPADGLLINMSKNFRSRAPLLKSVNGLFEALMTKASAEVDYDQSQRLEAGATFPDAAGTFAGSPVELHVIAKKPADVISDIDADEREAVLAASRIHALLGHTGQPPAMVTDRSGVPRPMHAGDVAILLRTMRVKAERYASVLRRSGLAVLADSTTGFFESSEVRDVLAVLRLIDNRRSEYDIAAYLRSPLCNWPDAEDRLATIRLAFPTHDAPWFHAAVHRYATERGDALAIALRDALAKIDGWRADAAERSVADVIWKILHDTAHLTWCNGLPDGEQRVANLVDLHERARQFDRFRRPTLSRFLHFLSNLEEESDLGMPSVRAGEEKAVRILSVHKSKGLEFPVVIIPDLGKDFNLRDAAETLLVDDTVGLGLRVVNAELEARYPSLASTVATAEIRRRALAEEMRVLYVATTRAREYLILIGTEKTGVETEWDAWGNHRGPMPAADVLAAGCLLDWVGPAAAQTEAIAPRSFERVLHTSEAVETTAKVLLDNAKRNDQPSLLQDLQPLPTPLARSAAVQQAIDRLERQYAFTAMSDEPAVTSVTAMTKRGSAPGGERSSTHGVVPFDAVLRPPRCVNPDRTLSPVDRGALTHLVLQRLNFAAATDAAGIRAQIAGLVQLRFVRAEDEDQADVDAIAWFAGTELGQRCRVAGVELRREFGLVYTAAPEGRPDGGDDIVMVRGRIDAMIVEEDGLVLIDYKTDRVTNDTVDARATFYQPQLDAYRTHLQRVTHRIVKETYLVFTSTRQVIAV